MSEAPNEATTDEYEPPGKEIEYASEAPDEALTDEGEPPEKETCPLLPNPTPRRSAALAVPLSALVRSTSVAERIGRRLRRLALLRHLIRASKSARSMQRQQLRDEIKAAQAAVKNMASGVPGAAAALAIALQTKGG